MRFVPLLVLFAQVIGGTASAQPTKSKRAQVDGRGLPDAAVLRLGSSHFLAANANGATLSLDGKVLATSIQGLQGARFEFMDTATGKSLHKFELPETPIHMEFTPDGKGLLISHSRGMSLVDAVSGTVVRSIDVSHSMATAFTRDGKWLAGQPTQYAYHVPVILWETATGKELARLPGKGASCKGLRFGPDGKRLLLASMVPSQATDTGISYTNESRVALVSIDTTTRKILGETTVGYSQSVALSGDGETVAMQDAKREHVSVVHLPTGRERCVIMVKEAQFAFSPDGKVLLTVTQDGQAALWDPQTGARLRELESFAANVPLRFAGVSEGAKTIAVLHGGYHSAASVVVWNGDTGKRALRQPGHEGTVACLAYAPGGKMLASGSLDRSVRLWDPATGAHLRKLTDHKDAITALAFSRDGKLLATSGKEGKTRLSSVADGKVIAEFAGPPQGARALAFAPRADVLFAGGDSSEVLAWKIADAKEVLRLKTGEDGWVLAFAEGGALALCTGNNVGRFRREEGPPEQLQVWNPSSSKALRAIPIRPDDKDHYGAVQCRVAVFSPDSRLIATTQVTDVPNIRATYEFPRLRVWERATGQEIMTLGPTISKVLAFSPDGRLLAAGGPGESGHLRVGYGVDVDLWDLRLGQKVASLPVTPECLAFSPDGSHVATGGRDHGVSIWKVPHTEPFEERKAPSAARRDAWWNAFGGHAKDAYKVMAEMVDAPDEALAILKARVQPIRPSDPELAARLFVQLDSKSFAERAKAQTALENLGEGAAHLIRRALEGENNLEQRRRLELLLQKCDTTDATSTLSMQQHRAVETLEWIATPAAKAVLRTWAEGAPGARLVVEAKAALARLGE